MDVIIAIIVISVGYFAWQYWKYHTSDHGAPYVEMEPEIVERVLEMAKVKENDVVYDLGSGDGRIPIMVGLKYQAKAVGIEIDRIRVLYSKWQVFLMRLQSHVTFLQKNIFEVDLSPATVVTMYLLQETNEKLEDKLLRELRSGTRVVSAAFNFPNWIPIGVDEVHVTPYGPLYLYEIGRSNPQSTSAKQSTPPNPTSVPIFR